MKYLGIDYGSRKIGLAVSDESGTMGFPHSIIPNDARLLDTLLSIIERDGIKGIVFGDSRNYLGDENPIMAEAREFAKVLGQASKLPVVFEPEMLTTQEARRAPDGSRTMEGDVDAAAAALILTSFLSHSKD